MQQIPERDWKLFSQMKPILLDRFCRSILDKAALIASRKGDAHAQYRELYQLILEEDKTIAQCFNAHSRSTALMKIAQLYGSGLMTHEELMTFSEPTREVVFHWSKHRS